MMRWRGVVAGGSRPTPYRGGMDFAARAEDDAAIVQSVMRSLDKPEWPAGLGEMELVALNDGTPVFRFAEVSYHVDDAAGVVCEQRRVPPIEARIISPRDGTVKVVPQIAPDLN
jgi:hypothetical protein